MTPPKKVCLGTIVAPHGVRGAVRIKSDTERPEDIGAYGPLSDESGERIFELQVIGRSKGVVQARVAGVDDRDAAEALRGVRLFVDREKLPPPDEQDAFYHADLIGLAAELAGGDTLGTVCGVSEFGAAPVLEIELAGGGDTVLVPFTKAAVPVVDLEGGKLVVDPPPGLLEADEAEPDGDDRHRE